MGRPLKLTGERAKAICDSIATGLPRVQAARAAGIAEATLYNWMKAARVEGARLAEQGARKRKDSDVLLEFLEDIKNAEAEGERALLARIRLAGAGGNIITETRVKTSRLILPDGNDLGMQDVERVTITKELGPQWQADAWILERRWPQRWARRDRVTNLNVEMGDLSNEQLERIATGEDLMDVIRAGSGQGDS